MKEMWRKKWYELVKIIGRKLDESKIKRLTTNSRKFTDGKKGTMISDCFIYMETDNGQLAEVGRIELQESRLIGKINSSAAKAYLVHLKQDKKFINLQSTIANNEHRYSRIS